MKEKKPLKFIHILLAICVIANGVFMVRLEVIRRGHVETLHSRLTNVYIRLSDFLSDFFEFEISESDWNDRVFLFQKDLTLLQETLYVLSMHHNGRQGQVGFYSHNGFIQSHLDDQIFIRFFCTENQEQLAEAIALQREYIRETIVQISREASPISGDLTLHSINPNYRISTRRIFRELNTMIQASVDEIWSDLSEELVFCP